MEKHESQKKQESPQFDLRRYTVYAKGRRLTAEKIIGISRKAKKHLKEGEEKNANPNL